MDSKKKVPSSYPWAVLYDMESQRGRRPIVEGQKGRPPDVVEKKNKTFSLSLNDLDKFSDTEYHLSKLLSPHTVFKSQVFGLAIRLLAAELDKLDEQERSKVNSWVQLKDLLIPEDGEA
jgi:hypothetical protein